MAILKKTIETATEVAGIVAALGIGGLFLAGTFMSTFLRVIPLWGHQIVGWILIVVALLGAFAKLKKAL